MAKLYYSIKEVCDIIDEEQYILRYWEKEFSILHPKKNKAGNRTYSPKDLLICKYLKHLIREERLHIKDVKAIIKTKSIAEILSKYDESENEAEINSNVYSEDISKDNLDNKYENISEHFEDENITLNDNKYNNELEDNNSDVDINLDISINEYEQYKDNEIINELTEDINEENKELENLAYIEYKSKIEDSLEEDIISDEISEEFSKESIENEEEIEKLLNLDIDKKIILKNHLFEDFEEFSVLPAELFYDKLKEQKVNKIKSDDNISDNEIEETKQEGILLSQDNLLTLINILKEIRKLIT